MGLLGPIALIPICDMDCLRDNFSMGNRITLPVAVDHSSRLAVRLSPLLVGFSLSIKSIVMQLVARGGGIGKLTFRNQRNLASSAYHFTAFVLNLSGLFLPARKSLGRSPARSDAAQI